VPAGNALGVHTHGYVEDFLEPLLRKRSVQIELKIAQRRPELFPPLSCSTGDKNGHPEKNPELADVLKLLGGIIDDATMQRLNFEVDAKQRKTAEVVEEFLRAKEIL